MNKYSGIRSNLMIPCKPSIQAFECIEQHPGLDREADKPLKTDTSGCTPGGLIRLLLSCYAGLNIVWIMSFNGRSMPLRQILKDR